MYPTDEKYDSEMEFRGDKSISDMSSPMGTMSSRERTHRQHYSLVKSAAITASYRLMQAAPHTILVQKTANAAVNGMRPHLVNGLSKKYNIGITLDIVDDIVYNHDSNLKPIVSICLVPEPRGRRDKVCYRPYILSRY